MTDWAVWGRIEQLPPPGEWRNWIFMGGRGAGKTRAGSEWVCSLVNASPGFAQKPVGRIALVGETLADVRDVMIEGDSGILACCRWGDRPRWIASKRQVLWPNGAQAMAFSSEDPDSLRGPQFEAAWCDEAAKWTYGQQTYDMLQFGLRLGDHPRQLITTTPRNSRFMRFLVGLKGAEITRSSTFANSGNLAPGFMDQMRAQYGDTRLGRQELEGELIEDRADALWNRAQLETALDQEHHDFKRIVVAVDPPASAHGRSDACGLVVAGIKDDGHALVLDDATAQGLKPEAWSARAVELYHRFEADCIIAEANQGGNMVETVLHMADANVPVKLVHARRGKFLRAEPVAALYATGRISHAKRMPELEDQMCDYGLDGLSDGGSPDRLDALVWALTELCLGETQTPRIRTA